MMRAGQGTWYDEGRAGDMISGGECHILGAETERLKDENDRDSGSLLHVWGLRMRSRWKASHTRQSFFYNTALLAAFCGCVDVERGAFFYKVIRSADLLNLEPCTNTQSGSFKCMRGLNSMLSCSHR